jgi:hypothetical protein
MAVGVWTLPFLLDLAFDLLPISFNAIPIQAFSPNFGFDSGYVGLKPITVLGFIVPDDELDVSSAE